jgi:hypothetical protein
MRDFFEEFRFYRDSIGLDGFLGRFDLEKMSPRQIYYIVHGRMPDSLVAATGDLRDEISDIFVAALCSDEFRTSFISRFLASFPEKKRIIFVHIPKCAGSTLSAYLVGRYVSLLTDLQNPKIINDADFFRSIKDLVLESLVSDTVYVHGHTHLSTYARWGAIRLDDQVISVVRNPVDLVISQINYVLTRIFSDESPVGPDTAGWRSEFGISEEDVTRQDPEFIDKLAVKILHHQGVVPANVMCRFLGDGTHQGAIDQIVSLNVELTDLKRYHSWCRNRWGVEPGLRVNESRKFIFYENFSENQKSYIKSITEEDNTLFDLISRHLDDFGSSHLIGRELLETTPERSKEGSGGVLSLDEDKDEQPSRRDLMLQFESLGENCEFGLVQRRCGADPLGLFRFSSAPYARLLDILQAKFEGLGERRNIEIRESETGREYMVLDKRYGLLYHAWVEVGLEEPEEIAKRETRRIPLLVRKIKEELSMGEKIFVYHGMEPLTEDKARELGSALRDYGPTTLLWVELADSDHEPGQVEWVEPGILLKGYMDRFAPGENAHDLSLGCWVVLCRNAHRLWRSSVTSQ